jgi:hypothetical protein
VDAFLPERTIPSFRERLVTYLEGADGSTNAESELFQKALALVDLFRDDFGVNDLIENAKES